MKRFILLIFILSLLFLCSCSNKPLEQAITQESENQALIDELNAKIETLESKIAELNETAARLQELEDMFGVEYKDGEYVYKDGRNPIPEQYAPYEEYDNTAVVNAYLSSDASSLDGTDKDVYKMASEILAEIIKDGMTDYEKELAAHDWIVENVVYDYQNLAALPVASKYAHTPYGALKYRRAVCVGYATTFKLFMDMLKIDNRLIHVWGEKEDDEHCWNLVKIEDSWYHIDTTWNTTGKSRTPYYYFNITDDAIEKHGFFKKSDDLPKADSIEHNYYYLNGTNAKDLDEVKKLIVELINNSNDSTRGIILEENHSDDEIKNAVVSAVSSQKGKYTTYLSKICRENEKAVFAVTVIEQEKQDNK